MVGVMVVGAAEASRGSPRPKPVEVDVTDISRKGDGIARIQGFVSFIENRKIGHRLKVKGY
ncbi:MAG: TRAM domain-containing protein [Candidatus Nitrosopolaris sp.]